MTVRPASLKPAWKQRVQQNLKKWGMLYLFALPGLVLFFLFSYLPMAGLVMVFQHYNPVEGFLGSPFVGLANFERIFAMDTFWRALRNTLSISALRLLIEFPLPILFALLLNEIRRTRFKKTVQTISYLPNFVSWVIVSGIWYKLLSPEGGLINQLLFTLGITDDYIYFMQDLYWFYPIIILTSIWKNLGYSSIYYLSAIASADQELYEAAAIDGAGRVRQAISITLPAMRGTIVLLFILQVSGMLSAGFDQLWTMGNLATRELGDILDTAVMRTLTAGSLEDLSIGAAMGFFKSVVGALLFFATNLISRRLGEESII